MRDLALTKKLTDDFCLFFTGMTYEPGQFFPYIFLSPRHKQSFPIRSKFYWTVGPVNLKLLPDQKKFHRTVGGQWQILTL